MKNSVWYIFAVCGLSILLLSNCKKEEESSFEPSCSTNYSYASDVAPIIQENCVSCHAGYATYSGVSRAKTGIKREVANGRMPKNGRLTSEEKSAIICWIEAGAEDN